MKHVPNIKSPLAWDWKRVKDYWPKKRAFVITLVVFILLFTAPLTRGVLKGIYKVLQWDPWTEKSATTQTMPRSAATLKEEKKPLQLIAKGKFEEVRAWEIKIPELPYNFPAYGLAFVLPPESEHDVRIEGQTNAPTASRQDYFLAAIPKIGRALSYEEIQAHLDRRESQTSPLGRMPFRDKVYTSSSKAGVISLQGFNARKNPVQGFEGRAIFEASWQWDARRSRKNPLEWAQWIVDLQGREAATLSIPDDNWRHVWIAPINEERFLPKPADTPIPFGGITNMRVFVESLYINLTRQGVTHEEAKKWVGETYATIFGGSEFLLSRINPYGPYVRIDNGDNSALNDVITWSADLNADLKGKQITLGINLKEKVEVPDPVKVIVGISR